MEILRELTSNSSAIGSDDGVTTSFQLSQISRPPFSIIKDKYMMKSQRLPENFVGLPGIDREGTIMMKNLAGKEW
nr:DNA-binding pseudobarrel domain-containing protein [Tanacetum cinerariifolium]